MFRSVRSKALLLVLAFCLAALGMFELLFPGPGDPKRDAEARAAEARALQVPFDEKVAQLEAAGLPVSFAYFRPPDIEADKNAAELYCKAFALLHDSPPAREYSLRCQWAEFLGFLPDGLRRECQTDVFEPLLIGGKPVLWPSPDDLWRRVGPKVTQLVQEHSEAIRLVMEGSRRPLCRFPLVQGECGSAAYPWFDETGSMAMLLTAKTFLEVAHNQPEDAVETCVAAIRLLGHTNDFPDDHAHLATYRALGMLWPVLCHVICAEGVQSASLERLLGELNGLELDDGTIAAMKEELYETILKFRRVLAGEDCHQLYLDCSCRFGDLYSWKARPQLVSYAVSLLNVMGKTIRFAEKRTWDRATLRQLWDEYNPLMLCEDGFTIGLLLDEVDHRDEVTALRDLVRQVCALRLWKLKSGKYPENLAELAPSLLAQIPTDPFSNKPFCYKRDGDGILLYNMGKPLEECWGNRSIICSYVWKRNE